MRRRAAPLLACLCALAAVGCAEGGGATDAGARVDAAPRDAAGVDADRPGLDAGDRADGGAGDAGARDAGAPDAGPPCTESPCRLVSPQCGCGPGQGCYREIEGAVSCTGAGTTPEGGSCTSSTDCAPGHICTGQPEGGCWRLCDAEADCTSPSRCVFDVLDDTGAVVPGPRICSRDCDPVADTGCPSGWTCTVRFEGAPTYTYCRRPGSGADFAGCVVQADCAAAHLCLETPDFSFVCYPLCSAPGTVAECDAPATCHAYTDVAGTPYGVCALP